VVVRRLETEADHLLLSNAERMDMPKFLSSECFMVRHTIDLSMLLHWLEEELKNAPLFKLVLNLL